MVKNMHMTKKDLACITGNPLFASTDRERLLSILESPLCSLVSFSPEEQLLSPENETHSAGILLDGMAEVSTPDPTHTALLRFLRPGDWFGIANLFSEEPYISVIRAKKASRALLISEEAIRKLLEEDRGFLYSYLDFLSGRIRYLNRKIGFLTAGGTERRLALYLSSLGTDCIRLEESLASLSELLDIGRASLYRAFSRLETDGYIKKEGRTIHILSPEALIDAYR